MNHKAALACENAIINQNTMQLVLGKIKARREDLKQTQLCVAGQLKISQNAYSKLELGQSGLSIEKLFLVVEILQMDIKELLLR